MSHRFPHTLFQHKGVLLILVILLFAGCGFHLAGQIQVNPLYRQLYLRSELPYNEFNQRLKNTLRGYHIELVDNAKKAPLTLAILTEELLKQNSGLAQDDYYAAQIITFSITYQLFNSQGHPVTEPRSIHANSQSQVNQVYSNQNSREQVVVENLHRDVIERLLFELNSPKMLETLHTVKLTPPNPNPNPNPDPDPKENPTTWGKL